MVAAAVSCELAGGSWTTARPDSRRHPPGRRRHTGRGPRTGLRTAAGSGPCTTFRRGPRPDRRVGSNPGVDRLELLLAERLGARGHGREPLPSGRGDGRRREVHRKCDLHRLRDEAFQGSQERPAGAVPRVNHGGCRVGRRRGTSPARSGSPPCGESRGGRRTASRTPPGRGTPQAPHELRPPADGLAQAFGFGAAEQGVVGEEIGEGSTRERVGRAAGR
jgi:hypothetical protein